MSKDDNFDKKGNYIKKGKRSFFDRFKFDTTDLIRAIEKNDVDEVHRVLSAGVNPNKADGMERLALPIAVDGNNPDVIRLLLKAKADPNVMDKSGDSPLYKAVSWENAEIVKLLIDAGADPNQSNIQGDTPSLLAQSSGLGSIEKLAGKADAVANAKKLAREKEVEVAKIEAAAKAKVEQERLDAAAKKQQAILLGRQAHRRKEATEKMDEIIEKKEDIQEKAAAIVEKENTVKTSNESLTPTPPEAVEPDPKPTAEPVATTNYDIKDGNYLKPLLKAIKDKDSKAVQDFSNQVKDINEFDGATNPLSLAIEQGNNKLGIFFLSKGANPMLPIPGKSETLLTMAIENGMHDLVEKILSQNEASIADTLNDTSQKSSPLHLAVQDAKMFHLLLTKGADPYVDIIDMPAPIETAIQNGSIAVLPTLAANQIDLNKSVKDKTPLEWAIHHNKLSWVVGLIEEGANTDTINQQAETPLMLAVRTNHPELVKVLIDEGADTTLINKKGQTALALAKELGDRSEIIEFLS